MQLLPLVNKSWTLVLALFHLCSDLSSQMALAIYLSLVAFCFLSSFQPSRVMASVGTRANNFDF